MKLNLLSTNMMIINSIEEKLSSYKIDILDSIDSYNIKDNNILIIDYDTVSKDINTLLSNELLPKYLVILESVPSLSTGRHLIQKGIKAYGNSKMKAIQLQHLIKVVLQDKTWIYPELTAHMATIGKPAKLDEILMKKLTALEESIVTLIMQGDTNEGISAVKNISIRGVKSHITSIYSKLHVNNRIGLILLLKL